MMEQEDQTYWRMWEQGFRAYDLDNDGFITRGDFSILLSKLGPNKDALVPAVDEYWTFLLAAADENKDGRISLDEWHRAWDGVRASKPKDFTAFPVWYKQYCELFFDILDENSDGKISNTEYEQALAMYGLQPIEGVFASFGPDENGHLSKGRAMELLYDMLCAPGGGKAALFWGVPATVPR